MASDLLIPTVVCLVLLLASASNPSMMKIQSVYTQSDLPTTKHRDFVIDLGNNITTNAKLNYPAVGQGPYPGVLLIHGYGPQDMNETQGYTLIDNETGSKIYPSVRPFFQITQYLSDRGFAVLQYDKRGVGENNSISDRNVYENTTFNDLKQDAEKALEVLIQQPEVDANKVTLIGHSEGTIIAPRVAIDNPDKVDNIVLMGAVAQNLAIGLIYSQLVTKPLLYAQEVLDHNHTGQLSVQEASEDPLFSVMLGNISQYNTDNDNFISINDELKPALVEDYELYPGVTPGEKCLSCPILFKSHKLLTPTMDIIGKIPSDISILIQQGENDSQTFPQQAFLLQQRLTELNHFDHTIKTYPDLGHFFYPASQWLTRLGPMQENVLQDLFTWLSDPVRGLKESTFLSLDVR